MDRVLYNLFIGNREDGANFAEIRNVGITAVVNVARDLPNGNQTIDFDHYRVGLNDNEQNQPAMMRAAIDVVHALMKDGRTVLVHCHEGKSRSAAVIAAVLVEIGECETIDRAENVLRRARPIVNIHPCLKLLAERVLRRTSHANV